MDFITRDHYRHIIEKVAKKTTFSEIEVAQKSIELAKKGAELNGPDDRSAHVGFYLIDKGLPQLEKLVSANHSWASFLRQTTLRFPLFFYLGSVTLLMCALCWGLLVKANSNGIGSWQIWVLGFLLALCCSYLSIALVNWLVTLFTNPFPLPRFDY